MYLGLGNTFLSFLFFVRQISKKSLPVIWRNTDFLFIFIKFWKKVGKGVQFDLDALVVNCFKNWKNKKLTHRIAIHKFSEKIHTFSSFFDDTKSVLHSKNAWSFFIVFLKNTIKKRWFKAILLWTKFSKKSLFLHFWQNN